MAYLRECWYMAGWAAELEAGPLGRLYLDEQVVLFRDDRGVVRAIADRCPHRFVKLSGGQVVNGALECPYHGLRFEGGGQCVHNPQGKPPVQAKVRSYPVEERHAILWIWMGDPTAADVALIPDFSCNDPDTHHIIGDYLAVDSSYRFGTDNILDLSHIGFSHRGSLAPSFAGAERQETTTRQDGNVVWSNRRYINVPLTPMVAARDGLVAGAPYTMWLNVRWHAPAAMLLHSGKVPADVDGDEDPNEAKHTHIFSPATAQTSHYWFGVTRPKARYTRDQAQKELDRLRGPFTHEDLPLLAEQQEAFGDRNFWSARPIILEEDAAAIRARRILDKLLREEGQMVAA